MKQQLVTFAGNHLGDDVRIGNVFDFQATPMINGNTYVVAAGSSAGVLTCPVGHQVFTPIVEPGIATPANASLVVSQDPVSGGALPIRGLPAGVPQTGFYLDSVQAQIMLRLDVPRNIVLGVENATTAATNLIIQGADLYGQLMTETLVVPVGTAAGVINLKKSFAYIASATLTAAPGVDIWLGVGQNFGFSYYVPDASYLLRVTYNGDSQNINASAANFFEAPAFDVDPENDSNDVRSSFQISVPLVDGQKVHMIYLIHGGSAESGWEYNPTLGGYGGSWLAKDNQSRVLNILGAPQYYNING